MTVDRIVTLCSQAPRSPRVIDRREIPRHGYTAVHVVVYPARANAVKATQELVGVVELADQSSGDPVRDVSDPLVLIALLTFNEIRVIRPLASAPTTITP